MDFVLNFVGVVVADFARSFRFYTEVLGVQARDAKEDWAFMETTGLVWELFGEGVQPPVNRAWGRGQANRPAIHVADLPGAIAELRARDVAFSGELERSCWGDRIELVAPEGIRWTLVQARDLSASASRYVRWPQTAPAPAASLPASELRSPHLGWVEVKARDVAGQRAFYRDVIELRPDDAGDGRIVFRQRPGEPLLFLEGGGQAAPEWRGDPTASNPVVRSPVTLSFETADIGRADAHLRARGVHTLVGVTERTWGGIDTIIADADGNPIQVVQYLA
jgi:catechol 2,3-dioxygenase-like lactoylglutathione lyase family enzyme